MQRLIPPYPSGGITERPSGNDTAGDARRSKNQTRKPTRSVAAIGIRTQGGGEQQDCLAPTNTLATTLVPRWSKKEAKVQPCHKGSTAPYAVATASFPPPLTRSLLAPDVEGAPSASWHYRQGHMMGTTQFSSNFCLPFPCSLSKKEGDNL